MRRWRSLTCAELACVPACSRFSYARRAARPRSKQRRAHAAASRHRRRARRAPVWTAASHMANPTARAIAMGNLIAAADKVANTTGVYGAFLKRFKTKALTPLVLRCSFACPCST